MNLSSVSDALDTSLVEPRFRTILFVAVGGCGLLLAAAGLYALTAFEVARRRREMGIRVALGATEGTLQRFLARDVLWPVFVGVGVGLLTTAWAVRFLSQFLYRVDGREPGLYAAGVAILVATAILTIWMPARLAARTDPAAVLRLT